MFEIGRSLQEARERRRVSYSQVEQATKIRSRYIRALEDEDFSVLPGPTYTKGFLRAYADYLGLDGQLFIDEFNSRHYDPRGEVDREIYPRSTGRTKHRRRKESNIVMIALAAIVSISAIVVLGFQSSGGKADFPIPPAKTNSPTIPTTTTPTTKSKKATSTKKQTTKTTGKAATNRLTAFRVAITVSGNCWITAHIGSRTGKAAVSVKGTDLSSYELQPGVTATVRTFRPVFLSFGAPGSIQQITVNGKVIKLPYLASGTVIKVIRSGAVRA
jgi:cytoskeleton protein RodZ